MITEVRTAEISGLVGPAFWRHRDCVCIVIRDENNGGLPVMHRSSFLSRRSFITGLGAVAAMPVFRFAEVRAAARGDVTFVFTADIHACLMHAGLPPKCLQEGKTDEALLRHVATINGLADLSWPAAIHGKPSGLAAAGQPIGPIAGIIVGGDMTDDGGGQVAMPGEGSQLQQFAHRYQQGVGPDRVHFPVYVGLGNHDLDQNGPPNHPDWYRREMRDYVELNHRRTVFYKPPLPATDYDLYSDDYSWDWGDVHLIQAQRFAGDSSHGAVDGLPWLRRDLADYASDGRPVVLFQHYGWDPFSTEKWDPGHHAFDKDGLGPARWWSEADRAALLDVLAGYNVVGIFHGHEHQTPMIYRVAGYDIFKPTAGYLGGFAVARIGRDSMDVVLAAAADDDGGVAFLAAFSKPIARRGG